MGWVGDGYTLVDGYLGWMLFVPSVSLYFVRSDRDPDFERSGDIREQILASCLVSTSPHPAMRLTSFSTSFVIFLHP